MLLAQCTFGKNLRLLNASGSIFHLFFLDCLFRISKKKIDFFRRLFRQLFSTPLFWMSAMIRFRNIASDAKLRFAPVFNSCNVLIGLAATYFSVTVFICLFVPVY